LRVAANKVHVPHLYLETSILNTTVQLHWQQYYNKWLISYSVCSRDISITNNLTWSLGILGLGTHLFVKVHRPEDSERTVSVFESSCHLGCYYQSNHSKVEAIPLSALPKDTTSEFAFLLHTIPFLCWTSSRDAV